MRFFLLAPLLAFTIVGTINAQPGFYDKFPFTYADTIRGALRPERTCFDVTYYGLNISIDMVKESIEGYVDIDYRVVEPTKRIQLDLYRNLNIARIVLAGKELNYTRVEDAFFVDLPYEQ
ncbi:MAG: M1 family peptidase, partial [Bacteroidota bacterium]